MKQKGYDVVFTRTTDVYQSPYEKAQIANDAGADYFVSFHRNSGENDNTYHGVQTLVYGGNQRAINLADSINTELEKTGFVNLGIEERPGLVVLRRTEMPAVLIETGFINSDRDNEIFDENFPEIAAAIAEGIENVVPLSQTARNNMNDMAVKKEPGETRREPVFYGVEVGRFLYETTANFMADQLEEKGFQSYVYEENGMLHVVAGKVATVEEAVKMQRKLRESGYGTMIISSDMMM